jgi:hypothetical protein
MSITFALPFIFACSSLTVTIGTLVLLRKVGGWSVILLVIGSAAYSSWTILLATLDYASAYRSSHPAAQIASAISEAGADGTLLSHIMTALRVIGFCFPVGFICYAFKARRT